MKKKLANDVFSFEISLDRGWIGRVKKIEVITTPRNDQFSETLKYMSDFFLAISLIKLNPSLQCPLCNASAVTHKCLESWSGIDPHYQMHLRSQERLSALSEHLINTETTNLRGFEMNFSKHLKNVFSDKELHVAEFWPLLDEISSLEEYVSSPLIFNLKLKLSKIVREQCYLLYNFLFHLRSLVAMDFNAHIEDVSHEAIKVDSVADYLARAEYVSNDAILYLQFKRLALPFIKGRQSQVQIEKLLYDPMIKNFQKYTHNASYLVDQLPNDFLERIPIMELEEALYLVQMDWLLGSDAGLLFRLREELFGFLNGYDNVFWPELEGTAVQKPTKLQLHVDLNEGFSRVKKNRSKKSDLAA